ncbi:MAG: prolyl oligopeptidase family serine peptidase [Planctomycetes bacterium]|nr:prolyl oligopeptidase family serine peptidase [Planctomycetota bacterium]MCC7399035.1 S9 family peptidase [Planctomycetota bacterium]
MLNLLLAASAACLPVVAAAAQQDPHRWLEQLGSTEVKAWVDARNAECTAALTKSERFAALHRRQLEVAHDAGAIPEVDRVGGHFYQVWADAEHPRGLLRRTPAAAFLAGEPAWQTVIDVGALAEEEHENWVFARVLWLRPDHDRLLLALSRGGRDATVAREFDVTTRRLVEGGFQVPEGKTQIAWRDRDSVFVGTDFGPGSLTDAGYPRLVKLWRRGTPLTAATTIAECERTDLGVLAWHDPTPGHERDFVSSSPTMFTTQVALLRDDGPVPIDKPDSATVTPFGAWFLFRLRGDWQVGERTFVAGSLLASKADAFLAGQREFDVLFTPGERVSLAGFQTTRHHVLLNLLDNLRGRVLVVTADDHGWHCRPLPGVPENGLASARAVDDLAGDDYLLTCSDFLTPTGLWAGTVGGGAPKLVAQQATLFAAQGLVIEQLSAKSADGTPVPYFVVRRESMPHDGENPTLLYAHGGFEQRMVPGYSPTLGAGWLERGGVYALACVRGGGEFGPEWHQAAVREGRQRSVQDLAAVATDLVARKITKPRRLGVQGASNGGLLVGNLLTHAPATFGAAVCQSPLLDMQHYSHWLAGASWVGEYGDPDVAADWAWLQRLSPYHSLKPGVQYPRLLLMAASQDDRVHPAHARKMWARLHELQQPVLLYENPEGGHELAATEGQAAFLRAMLYEFLWQELGG